MVADEQPDRFGSPRRGVPQGVQGLDHAVLARPRAGAEPAQSQAHTRGLTAP